MNGCDRRKRGAPVEDDRAAHPEGDGGRQTAQRLLNLLFIFNTATAPVPTSQIVSDSDLGYGTSNRASDKKRFRRDRERLAGFGIVIEEVGAPGASEREESAWALDRARTFIDARGLLMDDADLLSSAIDERLALSDSPLSGPLRAIRRRLLEACGAPRGLFDLHHARPEDACGAPDPVLEALWLGFSLRRKVTLLYVNARGVRTRRTVAPFGLFDQDGYSYLTGLDEASDEIRTFRTDRIERVWRPHGAYGVPADFDIRDYRFLPFDLARSDSVSARFHLPDTGAGALDALTRGRGTLTRDDGGWVWSIEVRDIAAAATFALTHARDRIVPLEPVALVCAWRDLIDRAVSAHAGAGH